MSPPSKPAGIIRLGLLAALLLTLAGCGLNMLRLTYGQAPNVVYWWLDDYVDFDSAQKPRVKDAIDGLFKWHRRTQLPDYATVLVRAQQQVMEPTTPQAVCEWQADVERRADVSFEQLVPPLADLAVTITPAQLKHIEKRFDKNNKDFRKDYLQPDLADRREAAVDRAVERAKMLYGRFDDVQLERIAASVAASPFDPELWLEERRARQQDVLQALRSLDRTAPGAAAAAQAEIRRLRDQFAQSPRPAYRAYAAKLETYNCAAAAQLHNLTTPAQRAYARDKLKGWEDDLRSLAAGAATAPAPATGPAATP